MTRKFASAPLSSAALMSSDAFTESLTHTGKRAVHELGQAARSTLRQSSAAEVP